MYLNTRSISFLMNSSPTSIRYPVDFIRAAMADPAAFFLLGPERMSGDGRSFLHPGAPPALDHDDACRQ
jgi:hypothetical protein